MMFELWPCLVIGTGFVVFWLICFPLEMFECAMFRDDGIEGKLMGLATWLFLPQPALLIYILTVN